MHNRIRAAAPPITTPNALWITDDLLADAFNRFCRLTHHHHNHARPKTSRRFGSTVPGPLEAHRRRARRRMGLAAAAASNGPPAPDFGALFGWGGGAKKDVERHLKYEPPSRRWYDSGLGAGPPPPPPAAAAVPESVQECQHGHILWPWAGPPSKRKKPELDGPITVTNIPPGDLTKTSVRAFDEILAPFEAQKVIELEHMRPIVDFLLSAADEPAARNVAKLVSWLGPRSISDEALCAVAQMLLHKTKLGTLTGYELGDAAAILVQRGCSESADISELIVAILEAAPNKARLKVVTAVNHRLSQTTDSDIAQIECWLLLLSSCNFMRDSHYDNTIWREVYKYFSPHLRMSQLSSHFARLNQEDFARVALTYWVPHVCAHSAHAESGESAVVRGKAKNFRFQRRPRMDIELASRLNADFKKLRSERMEAEETSQWLKRKHRWSQKPLRDVLVVLARYDMPLEQFLLEICEVFKAKLPFIADGLFWMLYRILSLDPELHVPPAIASNLINHYLGRQDDPGAVRRAWLIFKNSPTISLLECSDLPLRLIQQGDGTPDRIFYLLNRKTPSDITPPSTRRFIPFGHQEGTTANNLPSSPQNHFTPFGHQEDTTTNNLTSPSQQSQSPYYPDGSPRLAGLPRCSLPTPLIDLVHLIAYAYATQPQTSSRVSFRRVWDCYRFLQDRGAPLSQLLSRSLVQAGLLRPLQERKYLPLEQTRFVLGLVSKLEGPEVAQRLDHLVWDARRGNRIPGKEFENVDSRRESEDRRLVGKVYGRFQAGGRFKFAVLGKKPREYWRGKKKGWSGSREDPRGGDWDAR
ncbi:hypothetical protein KC343_g10645 [Hortaea werneckii]|uniref:Uncharacterized protein n=1 Tax=Hortaea werneckii TaxID=91943 RepID=A0A3M7CXL1_HORWE|nr:hypothetical protein KC343_g10645 [Hortaea werneckii]KAI7651990.1 hypothetical protein KC319_g10777 [Hortaea werneckii]KAI7693918.1 hypothetical protein KC322_g10555 [Hortaea werneckii]RMY56650.1 hypothetical protein D0864_13616 [Hortaea werneckii]